MGYYRLYFFEGSNGRIREFREFEAEDDLTASVRAAGWRGTGAMELWCRARKVKRWDGAEHLLRHQRLDSSAMRTTSPPL